MAVTAYTQDSLKLIGAWQCADAIHLNEEQKEKIAKVQLPPAVIIPPAVTPVDYFNRIYRNKNQDLKFKLVEGCEFMPNTPKEELLACMLLFDKATIKVLNTCSPYTIREFADQMWTFDKNSRSGRFVSASVFPSGDNNLWLSITKRRAFMDAIITVAKYDKYLKREFFPFNLNNPATYSSVINACKIARIHLEQMTAEAGDSNETPNLGSALLEIEKFLIGEFGTNPPQGIKVSEKQK